MIDEQGGGATGENAIRRTIVRADAVSGPLGIFMAHVMTGEATPAMAEAVTACPPKLVAELIENHLPQLIGNRP